MCFMINFNGNCQPQQQPDGLVAGSLDLVTMLLKASDIDKILSFFYFPCLKSIIIVLHNFLMTIRNDIFQNSPSDVVKVVYDVCFDPVIRIVLQSDDYGEMQVTFFWLKCSTFFSFYTSSVF